MTKFFSFVLSFFVLMFFVTFSGADDVLVCPGDYETIQQAVDAASPGDKIKVCPGIYDEQVSIENKTDLTIQKSTVSNPPDNRVIIQKNGMVENAENILSSKPIAAGIAVIDSTNITLQDIVVDSQMNGFVGCSPALVGIYYGNSSGNVNNVVVKNVIYNDPGGDICQGGVGIFAQADDIPMTVSVTGTSIHDYHKSGIIGNEIGTTINVTNSTVRGLGSTDLAAQNGIQIGYGATGEIRNNIIMNHSWSQCSVENIDTCLYIATNVLLADADNAVVSDNAVGHGQVGLAVVAFGGDNTNDIQNNMIFSNGIDGMIVDSTSSNIISNNRFTNSLEAGIWLNASNNTISSNIINEGPDGIIKAGGSEDPNTLLSSNAFYNILNNQVRDDSLLLAPLTQKSAVSSITTEYPTSSITNTAFMEVAPFR